MIEGAAQGFQRFDAEPAGQAEQGEATEETGRRQQRQFHVARLPQQQYDEGGDAQAVGGQGQRLRRLLLAANHAVMGNIAQLQNRRQGKAQQQQHAGGHALQRGQQGDGRQVALHQLAQQLQQHQMAAETHHHADQAAHQAHQ